MFLFGLVAGNVAAYTSMWFTAQLRGKHTP